MFFERVRAATHTLRFHLVLWHGGAILLTGLVVLIGMRFSVRQAILHDIDEVLREDTNEIGLALTEDTRSQLDDYQRALERKAASHDFQGWFVQFLGPDGKAIWSSSNTPPSMPGLTDRPFDAEATGRDIPHTYGGYRIIERNSAFHLAGRPHSIRVGSSLKFLDEDMYRIDRLVTAAALGVLLVSPLGGFILSERAVRPIAELVKASGTMRPMKMNERLPNRGTGDELDQLAAAFNQLLDRIADFLQQKQDFLADAAHELRTPLAAIRSMVEVQLNRETMTPAVQDTLVSVIDETASLEQLVNQLLLLAASDADRLSIHAEPVALDYIVQRSVEMFQAAADVNGIELVLEQNEPAVVEGNSPHLRQVLNNLFDNAIKFTAAAIQVDEPAAENSPRTGARKKPRVRIRLEARPDQETAILTIADNGIGISADHLHRIGDRFYRVDKSRQRDTGIRGTGLGLSICRAIIGAHHGKLQIASEPGLGTIVTVTLPLASETVRNSAKNLRVSRSER